MYEMLTGQRAFGGATLSDTIAAVLEREPDWHLLPTSTPPVVLHILRQCLHKDPKRRTRDIGDARNDLEREELREAARAAQRLRLRGQHDATSLSQAWSRPR